MLFHFHRKDVNTSFFFYFNHKRKNSGTIKSALFVLERRKKLKKKVSRFLESESMEDVCLENRIGFSQVLICWFMW